VPYRSIHAQRLAPKPETVSKQIDEVFWTLADISKVFGRHFILILLWWIMKARQHYIGTRSIQTRHATGHPNAPPRSVSHSLKLPSSIRPPYFS
jgi:hypothetical protein